MNVVTWFVEGVGEYVILNQSFYWSGLWILYVFIGCDADALLW